MQYKVIRRNKKHIKIQLLSGGVFMLENNENFEAQLAFLLESAPKQKPVIRLREPSDEKPLTLYPSDIL
jgi:hypothetical protein